MKFTRSELERNRSGRMSVRQRRAFLVDDVRKLLVFAVLLVCFASCARAVRHSGNDGGDYAFYGGGAAIWLIAIIIVVVMAGRSLRDALQGCVVTAAGIPNTKKRIDQPLLGKSSRYSLLGSVHVAGKDTGRRPLVTYDFEIGARSWAIDERDYQALSKLRGPHKVYYAACTRRILSYEAGE